MRRLWLREYGELAFLVPLAILALKGAIAGAATDAGIELATQLIENGGDIGCVDWGDVGARGVKRRHIRWIDGPSRQDHDGLEGAE